MLLNKETKPNLDSGFSFMFKIIYVLKIPFIMSAYYFGRMLVAIYISSLTKCPINWLEHKKNKNKNKKNNNVQIPNIQLATSTTLTN